MQFIKPDVSTVCMGMAMSMGAVLLAGGAKGKRYILPNSTVLIHQPLGGAEGQAADIEITAREILRLRTTIYDILVKHTGQTMDRIKLDSDRNFYMTAQTAVEYGIVDDILVPTHRDRGGADALVSPIYGRLVFSRPELKRASMSGDMSSASGLLAVSAASGARRGREAVPEGIVALAGGRVRSSSCSTPTARSTGRPARSPSPASGVRGSGSSSRVCATETCWRSAAAPAHCWWTCWRRAIAARRSIARRRWSPPRKHASAARAIDPAVVRQADVRQLPFADASFDNVVSTFPTEYIADPRALAEIARVLRPGGRLIVVLGATLLPANLLLLPFVAVQRVVYGRTRSHRLHRKAEVDEAPFTRLLRSRGLVPHEEIVRAPSWQAVLYSGEKSAEHTVRAGRLVE